MASILIIDDDHGMCYTLSNIMKNEGHEVVCAHSVKDGRSQVHSGSFDVVFLDVMMPDGSGLDLLSIIREASSNPEVIIITAVGDPDAAELAINNGAWDYIEKPSSIKEMTLPLIRALQYREKKKASRKALVLKREHIIGSSPPMIECLHLLAQAADSDINVLLTGETGTGKELFAKAVHENSRRAGNNFVVVDCTTIPETLVESTLFGHKKGAFTGADKAQEGLIKQADKGTLFLDEVGELPLSIQKGFLRTLQEHRFRPIAGEQEIESDFRLVAATNRDLEEMVKQGQFREDLLFRLRSFPINIIPLRKRLEDIKALAMHHVARICEHSETEIKGFSPEFFAALEAYDWPGNVRELFNALERAITAAHYAPILLPNHLPTNIRAKIARSFLNNSKRPGSDTSTLDVTEDLGKDNFPKIKDFRGEMERRYLEKLMRISQDSRQEACRLSGLSRTRLFELLKKHNIST